MKNHATCDKMLRRNKTVQEAYEKLRKNVDLTAGVLEIIAQKAELDEINNTIGILQQTHSRFSKTWSSTPSSSRTLRLWNVNATVQQFIDESGGKAH